MLMKALSTADNQRAAGANLAELPEKNTKPAADSQRLATWQSGCGGGQLVPSQ
jgi:hypothetical protein